MSMTLDEARRRVDVWMVRSYNAVPSEETMTAIRVILAALPAPEKRTPGQTCYAAMNGGNGASMWVGKDQRARDNYEAGALAVLKAHAVESVLTDEAIRFITNGYRLHTFDAIRAAVKSRLDNDGDDRIRAGRTDRT